MFSCVHLCCDVILLIYKIFGVVVLEEDFVGVVSFILLGLLGVAVCFDTVEYSDLTPLILCTVGWLLL